jgi:hypothetical protein
MPKSSMHVTLDDDVFDYVCHLIFLEQKQTRLTASFSQIINTTLRKQMESEKKEER